MPKADIKKVVLAYSGGLDTSIILKWLQTTYGCEVVTFTGDVGQTDELDGLEDKAIASGAVAAIVEDLRAASGNRIQAGVPKSRDRVAQRKPAHFRDVYDFR